MEVKQTPFPAGTSSKETKAQGHCSVVDECGLCSQCVVDPGIESYCQEIRACQVTLPIGCIPLLTQNLRMGISEVSDSRHELWRFCSQLTGQQV